MQIDTAGTYTLKYTAEDSCGNVTEVEREVVAEVISYRTVLYTDGTFIINEKSSDQAANEALHGAATNQYAPLSPTATTPFTSYIFTSGSQRPWNRQAAAIKAVEIGSPIKPRSTAWWFRECNNLVSVDLSLMDTENVNSMTCMFSFCRSLPSVDVSHFNTSNVTDMASMFENCGSLRSLDLSSFDTSKVETMLTMFSYCSLLENLDISSFDTRNVTHFGGMFQSCSALTTIYASNLFVPIAGASGNNMFAGCDRLVGGAGTTTSGNPKNTTYARIDNPPTAPGYFTAKA